MPFFHVTYATHLPYLLMVFFFSQTKWAYSNLSSHLNLISPCIHYSVFQLRYKCFPMELLRRIWTSVNLQMKLCGVLIIEQEKFDRQSVLTGESVRVYLNQWRYCFSSSFPSNSDGRQLSCVLYSNYSFICSSMTYLSFPVAIVCTVQSTA
jgi:hypothetical protein